MVKAMAVGKTGKRAAGSKGAKLVSKTGVKLKISAKARAKGGAKLNAKKLAKHEKEFVGLSFDEKLEQMKNMTVQQIEETSKSLSKLERSKIWNRHNTACKNNPELKAAMDQEKSKRGKGLLSLGWNLDPGMGPLYQSLIKTITVVETLQKTVPT
jgi:hypothetical protein